MQTDRHYAANSRLLITAQIKRRMLCNVTLGLSGLLTTRKITVWFPTKLGISSQGLATDVQL